jgi:uncharacterized membrane protein YfcA
MNGEVAALLVIGVAVVAGSVVQGLVGLGVGLVSAPVVTLLAPSLMPGTLLWMGLLTPALSLLVDRRDIDWPGMAWGIPARIPGTVLGVLLVGWFSHRELGIAVGVMVLVSVLVTWRAVRVPINRVTLVTAGFLSGVGATATSIGGPPIAVLYQHQPARQIRNTLAVYFALGAIISLVALAVTGDLTRHQTLVAAMLAPGVPLGLWLSRVLRRSLDLRSIRTGVLVVCAASALLLLARSLIR